MSVLRVDLVVVGDPSWQLTHYGFGIWSRTDADIIALDRANEGFSHSVALWTFERRRPRFEPDVAGEAAGVAGDMHPLAVVAADLKAIGAPTPITFTHCKAAVMAPLVPANVAIEQQAVNVHAPVDSLVIGRF